MYKMNTMDIKDVQNTNAHERRSIRVNIRLTPSQNKFIVSHNLSITKVMNEALKQLGYTEPKPEEIPEQEKERDDETEGVYWKNERVRTKGGRYENRRIMQYRPKRRRH